MNSPSTEKLSGKSYWIVLVSSMEQIIGAALSTVVGIMIPMINLVNHQGFSSFMQGLVGASGLIGIGVGSALIGKWADREGYLSWFRICPLLMLVASLWIWIMPDTAVLVIGLFLIGIGVGGGYSLDSSYISELIPPRWSGMMVGIAKASSAIGFFAIALVAYFIIKADPNPYIWNDLSLLIAALALLTFLMRIRWWESPVWLLHKGEKQQALADMRHFYGPDATLPTLPATTATTSSWGSLFKGENLKKVIFSGIPWACEGLGVYGIGVFLPILIMDLGISNPNLVGMAKVSQSVLTTSIINAFILVGFVVGLLVVSRMNNVKMLYQGFLVCAAGLVLLLAAYLQRWPSWIMITGFVIFEIFLNAGPHLITYIIPTQIFDIADRAAGSGIAALLGKVGAIVGVFLMPLLLSWGGVTLVMTVTIAVMIAGAVITIIYGKLLKLL